MHAHDAKIQAGFSLVELQVALIISAIMILAVAGISHISGTTYNKLRRKSDVYADLGYTMKLIRNRVRASSIVTVDENPTDPGWVGGEVLMVDSGAFGIFRSADGQDAAFVYVPHLADVTQRETLLNFGSDFDSNLFDFKAENGLVTIEEINGTMDEVPFTLPEVTIKRRT